MELEEMDGMLRGAKGELQDKKRKKLRKEGWKKTPTHFGDI